MIFLMIEFCKRQWLCATNSMPNSFETRAMLTIECESLLSRPKSLPYVSPTRKIVVLGGKQANVDRLD